MAAPTIDWQRLFNVAGNQYAAPESYFGAVPQVNYGQIAPYQAAFDPNTKGATDQGYWQMPDYDNLWRSDKDWLTAEAQLNAQEGTFGRTRADAVRRALIQFGAAPDPGKWSSGFGDVTPADIAAAQTNPFSTLKEIDRTRSMGDADLRAALGARGILSSGAWTGGENMLQRQQELTSTQETNKLLDALRGYESGYSSAYNQSEFQRQQAMQAAFGRAQANYLPQWMDTTVAPGGPGPGPGGPGGPGPSEPPSIENVAPYTNYLPGVSGGWTGTTPGGLIPGHGAVVENEPTFASSYPAVTPPPPAPVVPPLVPAYKPRKPGPVSRSVPSSIGAYIR